MRQNLALVEGDAERDGDSARIRSRIRGKSPARPGEEVHHHARTIHGRMFRKVHPSSPLPLGK